MVALKFLLVPIAISVAIALPGKKFKDKEFNEGYQAAKRNVETTDGKKYDKDCGEHFSEKHSSTMKACRFNAPNPEKIGFDIVLNIEENGTVKKALLEPKTNIGECLLDALKRDTFPSPPKPYYWVHMHMGFK